MRYFILIATLLFSGLLFLNSCAVKINEQDFNGQPITHDIWDNLVKKHVSETGKVNYKGFIHN